MSGGLKTRPQAGIQNAMPCPYNYRGRAQRKVMVMPYDATAPTSWQRSIPPETSRRSLQKYAHPTYCQILAKAFIEIGGREDEQIPENDFQDI
jgi:hypothetical protein